MARSSWKPPYLPSNRRSLEQVRALVFNESSLRSRSVRVATPMVGRRYRVLNGLRAVTLSISPEIVGHALGEFVPTRKRPRLRRSTPKGKAKPDIKAQRK